MVTLHLGRILRSSARALFSYMYAVEVINASACFFAFSLNTCVLAI